MALEAYLKDYTNAETVIDAEEQLLGAILIDPDIIDAVKVRVKPGDFGGFYMAGKRPSGLRGRIYHGMINCSHPDQLTVAQWLYDNNLLEKGDCAYLRHLVANCYTCLDYPHFMKVVLANSQKRTAQRSGVKVTAAQNTGAIDIGGAKWL